MKITELRNQHIQCEHGRMVRPQAENGEDPATEDVWKIVLTDKGTGDVFWLAFGREARDEIVRQLTGGIVLAGGELPKL